MDNKSLTGPDLRTKDITITIMESGEYCARC
jgi:hypothetical protein